MKIKKMTLKVEKVYNFFDSSPSPRMFWTVLNLGKNVNLGTPTPLDLIWGKFEIGKIEPPSEKKISLKRLKLSKNHSKTNLIFC